MRRRLGKFLILLCFLLAPLGIASAERAQIGPGQFVAGVPSDQFVHFAAPEEAGRQRMHNWCWAACVQMVLNYHGLYVKQEDIVRQIFGDLIDAPANPDQIMAALQGWAPDSRGRYSQIVANSRQLDPVSVIQDLEYRWPLIVGLSGPGNTGHAYVMTAVEFQVDQAGRPYIYRYILRDPYPSKVSRVAMSADEFMARCTFATRVHVRRL